VTATDITPAGTEALAAVTPGRGEAFRLTDVTLPAPRPDEVLVRVRAAGLCHSDLGIAAGNRPVPFPVLLGHEGAGEVARLGREVRSFAVGDRVLMSFSSCGECWQCLQGRPAYCVTFARRNIGFWFREDGSPTVIGQDGPVSAGFFGQSSFATYALTRVRNLIPVPGGLPLELAAPLGCGVQTGAGAVLNTLQVRAGQSLVVFGAGAVGMSAVMAGALCGADPLIVVEPVAARRALALELGASEALDPAADDVCARLTGLIAGADFAIDTTGRPASMRTAVGALHSRGTLALIGTAPSGTNFEADLMQLLIGRTVRGLVEGDAVPQVFLPMLIRQWRRGRFPLDRLVRTYPFPQIEEAAQDMRAGRTLKPVLVM
jgi:aryl-alcohol dehydrogenase